MTSVGTTMASMAEKQLNVDVPAELIERLDALQNLMDWTKKGMVAAAIAAFLRAPEEEQFQLVLTARREYHLNGDPKPTTDLGKDGAETLGHGPPRKRVGQRRSEGSR